MIEKVMTETVLENFPELREAIEKQKEKSVLKYPGYFGKCPRCGAAFLDNLTHYCGNCGQKIRFPK